MVGTSRTVDSIKSKLVCKEDTHDDELCDISLTLIDIMWEQLTQREAKVRSADPRPTARSVVYLCDPLRPQMGNHGTNLRAPLHGGLALSKRRGEEKRKEKLLKSQHLTKIPGIILNSNSEKSMKIVEICKICSTFGN